MIDQFLKQRNDILGKDDKSAKKEIDEKILPLCNTINKRDDMFTLSSCSGRGTILALAEEKVKFATDWIYHSHDMDNYNRYIEEFDKYDGDKILYFKEESAIIHIQTRTIELAHKLVSLGKQCSFNRCSIIAANKKYVVEIASSIPISVPIYDCKKLVDNDYLMYLLKISKKKLEKSWKALEKLEKQIKNLDVN